MRVRVASFRQENYNISIFIRWGEDTNMYQWRVSIPHLINAPRGCAGIRRSVMSADADPNPAPRLASES